MSDLMKQVSSLSWWIGVVFVGILVSLIASYIKPRTDRILGFCSARYREKNNRNEEAKSREIELLRHSEHEQIMRMHSVNYRRLQAIGIQLVAVCLILLSAGLAELPKGPRTAGMAVGSFVVVLSLLFVLDAQKGMAIVAEAREAPTKGSSVTLGSVSSAAPAAPEP